jgi:hypothetical protein
LQNHTVNEDKNSLLSDVNSWFYQDVIDDIIAECESRATQLLLGSPNCAAVASISFAGDCPITADECWGTGGGDEYDGGAETGGFYLELDDLILADEITVVRGERVISQLLIDTVLADPIGVSNNGVRAMQLLGATGAPYGFEISGVTGANLGGVLGFQNGDVVISVSGQPTTTYEDLFAAMSIVLSANTASVVLMRGGRQVSLLYRRGT